MKQEYFKSQDLYLSTAVTLLLKTPPSFETQNGHTVFVFPATAELYKAVSDYNSGISMNVYEYAQVLKRLRSEMIMRRNQR